VGGGGRVGGRGGLPLLIDHVSSGMFPTPRKRIRDHTWRKFLPTLKIVSKEINGSCPLPRSLLIADNQDL